MTEVTHKLCGFIHTDTVETGKVDEFIKDLKQQDRRIKIVGVSKING